MPLKLPSSAVAHTSGDAPGRTSIKIAGMEGWDIAIAVARENGISVKALFMAASAGIYSDHITVGTPSLAA